MTEGCDLGAFGSSYNLMRTARLASGTGMLANSADTMYGMVRFVAVRCGTVGTVLYC